MFTSDGWQSSLQEEVKARQTKEIKENFGRDGSEGNDLSRNPINVKGDSAKNLSPFSQGKAPISQPITLNSSNLPPLTSHR